MEKFVTFILPLLTDDCIRYQADETVKSMSVDYFRSSFEEVETVQQSEHYSLYYHNLENPDLIMHFSLAKNEDLSVSLIRHSDFVKEMKANGRL